ncbi:MAG TPA: SBBP repeat-containing protein, partial [Pyrinomonadaceae bacterium]|nr:SBBP repeat-containing protein [Pyrinomonadaceae bacterium]
MKSAVTGWINEHRPPRGLVSLGLALCLLIAPVPSFTTIGAGRELNRNARVKPSTHQASEVPSKPAKLNQQQAGTPFFFEENQGQLDPSVRFVARGADCSLFLTPSEAVYVLPEDENRSATHSKPPESAAGSAAEPITKHALRMEFTGANVSTVAGVDPMPGVVNYLKGNDPSQWKTNIRTFEKVQYQGLYPGIDLIYYGQGRQLEYDFVVAPGADAGQIALSFAGADSVAIDAAGDLLIKAGRQVLKHQKPHAYQEVNGGRREVSSNYQLTKSGQVAFSLGAYDQALPLIIDPLVLAYSTLLGGEGDDTGFAVATDNFGAVYVTGAISSESFPTTSGAFQTTRPGGVDVFVTKLFPGTNTLVYSTYLGGGGDELASSIAVDSDGNAYITGYTDSAGATPFPTTAGAFQTTNGGGFDCFVTKLNSTGSALIYSTYLGGGDSASARGIAIDSTGNAYIAGRTFSSVGPPFPTTPGAFQSFPGGGGDAFVAKLNP